MTSSLPFEVASRRAFCKYTPRRVATEPRHNRPPKPSKMDPTAALAAALAAAPAAAPAAVTVDASAPAPAPAPAPVLKGAGAGAGAGAGDGYSGWAVCPAGTVDRVEWARAHAAGACDPGACSGGQDCVIAASRRFKVRPHLKTDREFLDTAPAAPSDTCRDTLMPVSCMPLLFWMNDIEEWTQCGRELCDTTPVAVIVPLLSSKESLLRNAAWDALLAM
jgi:hypothetical protein